ncbi:hypothetical protein QYF36_011782 [Acer negundo]|nr:hypothetical protein QYF36_011782 [Acer negundo]
MNLTDKEAPIESSGSSMSSAIALRYGIWLIDGKTTKKKGWINHGIKGPESIADHMYCMALIALIPGLNRERCIKIAIVHDIVEGGAERASTNSIKAWIASSLVASNSIEGESMQLTWYNENYVICERSFSTLDPFEKQATCLNGHFRPFQISDAKNK